LVRDSPRNTYEKFQLPCEAKLDGLEISSDDKFLFTITDSGLYEMRSLDPHESVIRIEGLWGGQYFYGMKSLGDKLAFSYARNGYDF
jgi:hypothetical protein